MTHLNHQSEQKNRGGFGVTADLIEAVLRDYSLRVTDTQGRSFQEMSEEQILWIDCKRVERAALRSGDARDEQTQGALEEIKDILVEHGVLEF